MAHEERQQLGRRIRALRTKEKLTLRKFAEMIGISKDYLVDIELARKSPTIDTLVKIAGGFDMTLSELFEGIEKKPKEGSEDGDGSPTTILYYSGRF